MSFTSPQTWTTSQLVTASDLNTDIRDNWNAIVRTGSGGATSWTPSLQAVTINPATITTTGAKWLIGPLAFGWAHFAFSAPINTGSGIFFVDLSNTPSGVTASSANGQAVGSWHASDSSNSANDMSGTVYLRATNSVFFRLSTGNVVSDSTPFTWAAGDAFSFFVVYPVAAV